MGCRWYNERKGNTIVQKINNMHGTNVNDWTVAKYVSVDRKYKNYSLINDDCSRRYMYNFYGHTLIRC